MPNHANPIFCELAFQILNIIIDPISIKNSQLQFIFVNDAFCALHNKTREAILGRTAIELLHDAFAESVENQEKSVLETGTEHTCKFETTGAGENSRTLEARTIRLADTTAGLYVFSIAKNATETHPAPMQNPKRISKSGNPVARESIHDLNNALNVIRGYSELLLEDLAPEDRLYKDLDAIYQAAKHASEIALKF